VFCPKYRKPVLNPPIDAKLKKLIQQVCDETQSELIEMEVMPPARRPALLARITLC
jgi:putative transposase